ncbi:MAG: hypothetical protein JGK24_12460 [Microcoleus sp. PH2017_29_MFU_D_A]|jgi:hypothetical protein|uniref:hypothetical protein n=1 Tax=unclassified Microcoleus TaxID=2642155 RepID=UPI001DD8E843|nr:MULTISPECIES: hypothetical protein [unclassified Microcoleus]MCC3417711.1 hypothetical protein [Microcoleus sp. PH2017_07_MST_O_A]MCC3430617.1 hypothetical protein [Microcoleus sp. PH2017_04_SCI_O_A]MCC3443116.1 hypothetical protein [Microcoleus sp. PH2017_03_ELD_O_A]MCC3468113.1 hypothetical protein [Microcoleus sp. PH2017_06_SFM_O_A]MCC3504346.1 hypothetical protein [Microcoleus sp. PH2017_19_SFW_U_A]MCC3508264.1 hypothetical protein [Microcoleus sp. PH2017_17_BER_D_A]TAE14052.1 MAG: hy
MKPISENNSQNNQNRGEKQPNPLILALVLTGILAWEMYPALIHTAAANAGALKQSLVQVENQDEQTAQQFPAVGDQKKISYSGLVLNSLISEPGNLAEGTRQNPPNQLPANVAAAVRQELSRSTGIAADKLKVTESSRQSWPNTCLGLAKSDEICGQMIVEGWRVVVSDGGQTWVYRTNARGNVLRLEKKVS